MSEERETTDTTSTTTDEALRLSSLRRDVMKAVGVGGGLGVLGGSAAASEHNGDVGAGTDSDSGREETDVNSVHTVRTLIGPSTNPQRPADFFYQPTGLHVDPGDVVRFVFETPDHTVTSYHPAFGMERRIPAGVDPFSSPIMGWDPDSLPEGVSEPPAEPPAEGDGESAGDDGAPEREDGPEPSTWLYAFEEPGVYDVECAPHEGFGMAMRVVVGDGTDPDFETADPENLPEPRAGPVGLARMVLTDPNLQPEAIVDAGRVEWSELRVNQQQEQEQNQSDGERDPPEE